VRPFFVRGGHAHSFGGKALLVGAVLALAKKSALPPRLREGRRCCE
jgi:hypothetical protein